jgi:hypothetical protein
VSSFTYWAPLDPGGVPGDLLFGTQRQPPLNEKEADMAGLPTPSDCPFDEPCKMTSIHVIVDWDVMLFDQVGEYDALGPFSDRDTYPGPA